VCSVFPSHISWQNWLLHLSILRCRAHLSELVSEAEMVKILLSVRDTSTVWAVVRVGVCRLCCTCTLEILVHRYTSMYSCTCKFTLLGAVGFMCRRAWRLDCTYREELQLTVPRTKEPYIHVFIEHFVRILLDRPTDTEEFGIFMLSNGFGQWTSVRKSRNSAKRRWFWHVRLPNGSPRMIPKIPTMSSWTTCWVLPLNSSFGYVSRCTSNLGVVSYVTFLLAATKHQYC
jgi:hypothetical protein